MSSCILVVDDDVALAEMIGIVLENEGYRVVFCSDGSQALSQFQEHNPDLVLLDVADDDGAPLDRLDGITFQTHRRLFSRRKLDDFDAGRAEIHPDQRGWSAR